MSGPAQAAAAAAPADGVFHRTRCHCCECGVVHEAVLRDVAGAVVLEVRCPRGPGTAQVSSDAATFRRIRERSALPDAPLASARGVSWVNILEITRDCNCACPVCFAGARPGAGGYLSVDEVREIARSLRAQGLKAVSLSGGEPTLHPDLERIVRTARRERLDVTLVSNGLRLGEDPSLARRLAASGVAYAYLQLDTLREEVCAAIRGDRKVEVRLRALRHAREGGLRLGINATVVRENLPEVGALLRRAVEHAPALGIVTFLAAGRTGRYLLGAESTVTREDVMHALVGSGAVAGLSLDHFWPFPRFAPLGLDVHPDCGALLLLALDRGVLRPLDEYLDVAALHRRMREARGRFSRTRALLLFNVLLWRSIRLRKVVPLARMLLGMLLRRGRSSVVAVVVEQFLDGRHQDEERLARCTTCSVQAGGARVPMCLFQHADARRAAVTRVNQR
ncbi:MAG TPA: radical SAM protein [Anaeromyxobacter sp.]|nr:radical SAM protein [Anaeromyxobacter sp.]